MIPPNSSEFVQGYPHSWLSYELFPISSDRTYGPLPIFAYLPPPDFSSSRSHLKKEALVKNWLPTSLPRNERSPQSALCTIPLEVVRSRIKPMGVSVFLSTVQRRHHLLPYAYAQLIAFHWIVYGHFLKTPANLRVCVCVSVCEMSRALVIGLPVSACQWPISAFVRF